MSARPSAKSLTRPGLIPLWCALLAIGFAVTLAGGHYADLSRKSLAAATTAEAASQTDGRDPAAGARAEQSRQLAGNQRILGYLLLPAGIFVCIFAAVALTLAFFKVILTNMRSRGAL
jgi:hypothetical protein